MLVACNAASGKNETKVSIASKNKPAMATNNNISFKVNGVLVKTGGWNISRFTMGAGIELNITTNMHTDKRTIMFNIKGVVAGEYSLSKTDGATRLAYGDYKPDYGDLLNSYSFQSGKLIITSIDNDKNLVNAKFFGTVKNTKGDTLVITEGLVINGKITPGITKY